MLNFYEDTEMAWDTEAGKWVKPRKILAAQPEPQAEPAKEFSFEVETMHFMDYLKQSEEKGNGRIFKSEFSHFDEQLEGLETGEVVVISGHAKNGKTLFAESWLRSMMLKDPTCKAIFFSFEVKTRKLLVKYLEDSRLPLYVPKILKTMDFDWLYQHCKRAKEVDGCSIVLIDHLHFMVDMNTKQNMSLNIGAFMRRLKQDIAIGLDMAVILIAHQTQGEKGREASVHTMRDSSFVGQEADSVIIVSRRKNFDPVERIDYARDNGEEKGERACTPFVGCKQDDYSHGLMIVTIGLARRSSVFDYRKLFKVTDKFAEEM